MKSSMSEAPKRQFSRRAAWGASLTEFIVVTPVALLLILATIQMGLAYMAKLTLNNAVFMAARHGANHHALKSEMEASLAKGLIPFHIKSDQAPNAVQLGLALGRARLDMAMPGNRLTVINPKAAFQTFGIRRGGVTYIPNDNLEYRANTVRTVDGKPYTIRDANVLKIQYTYGYKMVVPLIPTILRRLHGCSGDGGVEDWNRPGFFALPTSDCVYYLQDKIPIVSYATVQMQSDPHEN